MNIIDIVILAVLAVSVVYGLYRGFISGVLSVAALIGSAALAFACSGQLADWLNGNRTLVDTLIYGYTMEDVRTIGKQTYQLLIPAQETNEGIHINNVRLMVGDVDLVLHLPSECIAAKLGTRGVYGFSTNTVYVSRFGEASFTA